MTLSTEYCQKPNFLIKKEKTSGTDNDYEYNSLSKNSEGWQ